MFSAEHIINQGLSTMNQITTLRLNPFVQKTKYGIIRIEKDLSVSLDFNENITRLMISPDGVDVDLIIHQMFIFNT